MSWELIAILIVAGVVARLLFSRGKKDQATSISIHSRAEPSIAPGRFNKTPVKRVEPIWHPPGTAAHVKGHAIRDGMVYVGDNLGGGLTSYYTSGVAPCFIDVSLPVAQNNADVSGAGMHYWPSYSEIAPNCRLAYLEWLAGGKQAPQYSIGYVFLYFYGLERRLLTERPDNRETDLLMKEILRLRHIYGGNPSFQRYSRALLEAVEARHLLANPDSAAQFEPDLSATNQEMPLPLRIAIAFKVKREEPLSFELATAGYLSIPEFAGGSRLRVGATRTRSEFLELMHIRFTKSFPDGFKLRHKKSSQLRIDYKAASKNERVDLVAGMNLKGLPDPIELTWTKMVELGEEVMDDLSPYARFVGRNPEKAASPEALLLLPAELQANALEDRLSSQTEWLEDLKKPITQVALSEIATRFAGIHEVDQRQFRMLVELLHSMGYGMEPDPLFGGTKPRPADLVYIFSAPDKLTLRQEPRPAYMLGTSIATLVAGVATSSTSGLGPEEIKWLDWIRLRLGLNENENLRLRAHVQWLVAKRLSVAQVKRAISTVPIAEREEIADFAAGVAAADGIVEKSEVAFLEKIYDGLGVPRQKLYGALHRSASETAAPSDEPVTVERPAATGPTFRIPPAPERKPKRVSASPIIDARKVQTVVADTKRVSVVLADIFKEEEASKPPGSEIVRVDSGIFTGLDAQHAKLVAILIKIGEWSRAAFEEQARALDLMPDGALEVINEWALDTMDEALIEIGDPLSINVSLLQESTD